jgi:membrane glycosyltransferase
LGDRALLEAHKAMLPPPRRPRTDPIDPVLLQARAKLDEAETLAEVLATLSSAELVSALSDASALQALANLATVSTMEI